MKDRLARLDGLRGLAALFVVFSHFDVTSYKIQSFPLYQKIILRALTDNGTQAVVIFFILTGFLMGHLYPKITDRHSFLLKRYLRLWPLLLSLSFASTYVHITKSTSAYAISFVTLISLLLTKLLLHVYMKYIHKYFSFVHLYFLITLTVITIYLLISRQSPSILQSIHTDLLFIFTWLTNATASFWVGDYIEIVNGVYWTLFNELFFYLIYALFIYKFFITFFQISTTKKIVFSFVFIFWFVLFYSVIKKVMAVASVQLYYLPIFIVGIAFARYHNWLVAFFERQSQSNKVDFIKLMIIVSCLMLNGLTSTLFAKYLSREWALLVQLPVAIVIFAIVIGSSKGWIFRFFSSKILVFLGTVSYSLYLSHTLAIAFLKTISPHWSFWQIIFHIGFSSLIAFLFALIAYSLLERDYFSKYRFSESFSYSHRVLISLKNTFWPRINTSIWMILSTFILILLIIQVSKGELSWMTQDTITPINLHNQQSDTIELTEDNELIFDLFANAPNLGILHLPLSYRGRLVDFDEIKYRPKHTKAIIEFFRNDAQSPIHTVSLTGWRLDKTKDTQPVGIPVGIFSRGDKISIRIKGVDAASDDIIVYRPTDQITTTYILDKSLLFRDPAMAIRHLVGKMLLALSHPFLPLMFFAHLLLLHLYQKYFSPQKQVLLAE